LANLSERPLDSVTVRVVTELAAALLPSLTAEMRKAVGEETAKAAERVGQAIQETGQDMGEALSSLKEAGRVGEGVLAALNETLPMLGRAREDIERTAQRSLTALDEAQNAGRVDKEALSALGEALSSIAAAREKIETTGKDAAAILAEVRTAAAELGKRPSAGTENSASALTERLAEIVASAGERLSAAAARLESAADGVFSERISNELAEIVRRVPPPDSAKPELDGVGADISKLLRHLEEAIPEWEGILKADGRAQTKELSELSAEITEVAQDTKMALLASVREVAEKRAARNAEWKEALMETERAIEHRMAKLEKTAVLAAAVSAFLAAGLLAFLM
jgi:hypothetical protein